MRKSVPFFAIAALVTLVFHPSEARAQLAQFWKLQPLDGKLIASVNVGIQVGDNDLARQSTFELYDEIATVDISQTINNGGFIEFGGVYKVRPDIGVGLAYGFLSNSGGGRVAGELPHPLFFDQPRSFSQDVSDLKHTEHSLHFQAVYFVPFTDKVDFSFSIGPSLFNVTQGLLRGVRFSENPPSYTTVTIDSVDSVELSDSGWGINLGADMTYTLTPRIGVAALLRYTHGSVEFNPSDNQTADVTAGGLQLGAGVRVLF
jgi:hypothetical protein